jgi:hypothetical protein
MQAGLVRRIERCTIHEPGVRCLSPESARTSCLRGASTS